MAVRMLVPQRQTCRNEHCQCGDEYFVVGAHNERGLPPVRRLQAGYYPDPQDRSAMPPALY